MAKLPALKNIDGISLLRALMGNWKVVRLNVNKTKNSPVELYDLVKDPQEKKNIAAKNPAIVKQVEQLMKKAHTPDKDWPLLVAGISK